MAVNPGRRKGDDRLINPHGFKHYRRKYSRAELRWGLVILLILGGIGGWIAYRGAHPPPDIYNDGTKLLAKSKIKVYTRPTKRITAGSSHGSKRKKAGLRHRLLPDDLGGKGWQRRALSRFSTKNLYEKINGRAGYFKSFGFRMLYFTTLFHKKSQQLIDIEMYNMGTAANALGTYAGELSKKARPQVDPRGISHIARNALFVSRGRYYLRVIGSSENKIVVSELKALRAFFKEKIKGEPLPWAYGLLIAHMPIKAAAISYERENAFGFGFAKDVFKAKWGKDAFLFVCAKGNAADAKAMAAQFRKGFLSYGEANKGADGIVWIKDRYINTFATADAVERWVVGIQGAPSIKAAAPMFAKLKKAIQAMSPALRKRAVPSKGDAKPKAPRPRPRPAAREGAPAQRPAAVREGAPTRRPVAREGDYQIDSLGPATRRKAPPRRPEGAYEGGYGAPAPKRPTPRRAAIRVKAPARPRAAPRKPAARPATSRPAARSKSPQPRTSPRKEGGVDER